MKKLALISLVALGVASCSKKNYSLQNNVYYKIDVVDSVQYTTENMDNPGTFLTAYDTLTLTIRYNVKKDKSYYKVERKAK